MTKRKCAKCGEEKEVRGAKTCVNDHFICYTCGWGKSSCPLCGKSLK